MIFTNIDTVVRRWLLERNLPIHFYAEGLFHSTSAIRELSFDTLKIVNTSNLPINSDGSVDLPGDFVDDISLSIPSSGTLIPLAKQDWITPLRIHDSETGLFVSPNEVTSSTNVNLFYGFPSSWIYYWNIDDYGSFTGRRFGAHGGSMRGYRIIKERRQIQLTDSFNGDSVVLQYISDGQSSDNATQVDTLATRAIQTWIDWQFSPSKTSKDSMEARTFYNEKRRLRSLLNPLTKTDIQNVIRSAYTASIKF